jgi:hypothetical protein
MPLDITKIRSAHVVEDEGKIVDLMRTCDTQYRERSPLQYNADPGQTTILECAGRVVMTKRSNVGALERSTVPELDELKKLAISRGIEWRDGYEKRVLPYWASDARGDRHGDVVDQSWDFTEYQDNPIMLFSHDWSAPPIGGVLDWDVTPRKTHNYEGDALRLLSLFADEDTSAHADSIFRLANAGFLKAGSVGFFPGQVIEVKDKRERQELGIADWGLLFLQNKLIEWSPCSVPANPGAGRDLQAAKSAGLIVAGDVQALREMKRIELSSTGRSDRFKREDAMIVGTWKYLYPEVRIPDHQDADMPIMEPVRDSDAMVSLVEVSEMIERMQRGMDERLSSIQHTQDDILIEVRDIRAKREDQSFDHPAGGEDDEADSLLNEVTRQMSAT